MKYLSFLKTSAWVALLFAIVTPSFAQMGGPSPGSVNAGMIKLFGDVKAFSAKCDTRMLDAAQKETMSMPTDFALSDGKVRVEVDMTQMKSTELPPEAIASMKKMGMDRVISIMDPEKKTQTFIYPGIQSCMNLPLPKADVEALEKESKIEKTSEGNETIDGHPCVKSKVVISYTSGRSQTFMVWNATDMKNFPVQIQSMEANGSAIMLFKQVQMAKPDAKQFEVPADYKVYKDMPSFQQAIMQRMMNGAGAGQ
jgi:hypothetical protein